jgi:hypothetical protein
MAINPNSSVTAPVVRNSAADPADFGIVSRVLGTVTVTIAEDQPDTSAVGQIGAAAVTTTLLAAGTTTRKGVSIFNDSPDALFIRLGAGATAADFTVRLLQNDFYEVPEPVYIGIITGIWVQAGVPPVSGTAFVTELTKP